MDWLTAPTRWTTLTRTLALTGAIGPVMFSLPAFAVEKDDGLSTDRPDFVESSQVVGKGVFQLETSVAYERNTQQGADVKTWTTPTLLRFGVSDVLELRLETDAFTSQRQRNLAGSFDTQSGFSDVSLGLKWHLSDETDAGAPSTALLFHVDVDSGAAAFRRNGLAPSIRGVAEWSLAGGVSLGTMAGVVFDKTDTGETYRSGILAVTMSKPLGENLRGFMELAGRSLAEKKYGGNVVTLDAGLAYALDSNTQFDAAIAVGLNKETPDYGITVGFSRRFK